MRIRFSHLIPLLGVLFFSFVSVPAVLAQDTQCQEELSQANALYTTGRFDEAIQRVDACLAKEEVSNAERRTAYRLKGLCFIGKGVEIDAKDSVKRLLELIPDYQPDPVQDPPDFVAMVDELKEEISNEVSSQQGEEPETLETPVEEPVEAEAPVTTPSQEPVAEVAKKKKKGSGRFLLIGAGVAAVGVGAAVLLSGGDGGGGEEPVPTVVIADPPPLP